MDTYIIVEQYHFRTPGLIIQRDKGHAPVLSVADTQRDHQARDAHHLLLASARIAMTFKLGLQSLQRGSGQLSEFRTITGHRMSGQIETQGLFLAAQTFLFIKFRERNHLGHHRLVQGTK